MKSPYHHDDMLWLHIAFYTVMDLHTLFYNSPYWMQGGGVPTSSLYSSWLSTAGAAQLSKIIASLAEVEANAALPQLRSRSLTAGAAKLSKIIAMLAEAERSAALPRLRSRPSTPGAAQLSRFIESLAVVGVGEHCLEWGVGSGAVQLFGWI